VDRPGEFLLGVSPAKRKTKRGRDARATSEGERAGARELRDRYLEHLAANEGASPAGAAKYHVARALPAAAKPRRMLSAA
jgi:hypothetical protein